VTDGSFPADESIVSCWSAPAFPPEEEAPPLPGPESSRAAAWLRRAGRLVPSSTLQEQG